MAYFQYLSDVNGECLLSTFQGLLEAAGLKVSKEFSNSSQIYAEEKGLNSGYQSVVKVLISWSDKHSKQCSIEVRSDEPFLKSGTRCENIATALHALIPPKV